MRNKSYRLLSNIFSAIVIFSFIFSVTSPDRTLAAPPPPVKPSQTEPGGPTSDQLGTRKTPPSPDALTPQMEKTRVKAAIDLALKKYLDYWGSRYKAVVSTVNVDSGWAIGTADWQSSAKLLPDSIQILAHQQPDGTWRAVMPGSDNEYLQWLNGVPDRLVSNNEKAVMGIQAAKADALKKSQAQAVSFHDRYR